MRRVGSEEGYTDDDIGDELGEGSSVADLLENIAENLDLLLFRIALCKNFFDFEFIYKSRVVHLLSVVVKKKSTRMDRGGLEHVIGRNKRNPNEISV